MSQALTTTEPVSAQALEHVLGTGDLSKLTTQQRVEYLVATCKSLGLNPLTRPIRFLSLNGQIQIYFTRDGTDQLRSSRNITLHVVDKSIDAGVLSVTVRARTKDGREDEDIGAVVLPASGDSRANALMRAITKAKRRVTLSICGLGQTDESELDTMPGARVFDAEDDVPVAPIRTARDALNDSIPLRSAAAATPRAPRRADPEVWDTPPASTTYDPADDPADDHHDPADVCLKCQGTGEWRPGKKCFACNGTGNTAKQPIVTGKDTAPAPERTREAWVMWINGLIQACDKQTSREGIEAIAARPSVEKALAEAPPWAKDEIDAIIGDFMAKLPAAEPGDDLDEIAIKGEEHLAAG